MRLPRPTCSPTPAVLVVGATVVAVCFANVFLVLLATGALQRSPAIESARRLAHEISHGIDGLNPVDPDRAARYAGSKSHDGDEPAPGGCVAPDTLNVRAAANASMPDLGGGRLYTPRMLDHVGIQVRDVEASVSFYLNVFAPLGFTEAMRFPAGDTFAVGIADPGGAPAFWLSGSTGPETRELHIAFTASDRAAVDAVHEAAVKHGVEVLHEPREWPEYHPAYYAVFLRDPDGHNVEAVCHR